MNDHTIPLELDASIWADLIEFDEHKAYDALEAMLIALDITDMEFRSTDYATLSHMAPSFERRGYHAQIVADKEPSGLLSATKRLQLTMEASSDVEGK